MRNVARLPDSDRGELFRNTADKMGLNDAIVEKDFWVCFTLDHLFHRCLWKDAITFKGGTSLSKAFNLISRFSEDIDLILDWRVLGYGKDEPWEKRSNTKQNAFNKEANARAEVFLAEQFCPTVQAEVSRELGCEANTYIDETDKQTVMELLMAARVISGVGHSAKSAGSVFGRGGSTATGTGAAASGFASGFASRFKGNSYVRDAVVDGGTRMGMGGGVGFVGRVFGGVAARNGAMLMGESIASVAARPAEAAGTIAGDIADRSLGNYMPQLAGHTLKGTQISGGHISTTATGTDGKVSSVEMFNTAQFEKPAAPHSVVTATDGSTWYQMASGEGRNAFYDAPGFTGSPAESEQVAAAFPGAAEGTVLRNTGDGIMEAGSESGNSLWYNSAYYNEPEAPHTVMQAANGVDWYAMQQHAEAPAFEQGEAADTYNQAAFRNFMPGFEQQVAHVDGTHREDGHFEVRHADGSGTAFYDTARFAAPRGDYQVYEDVRGQQWIAIHGDPAVERKPVFEDGKPVYDGENVRTVSVESVRYKNMPSRFKEPEKRPDSGIKAPKRRK